MTLSTLFKTLKPEKILKFLKDVDPDLYSRFDGMMKSGIPVQQMLKVLDRPDNTQKFKDRIASRLVQNENPLVQADEIRRQNQSGDLASRGAEVAKKAGKGAAMAAGYLLTRGMTSLFDMPTEMGMPHPGPQVSTGQQPIQPKTPSPQGQLAPPAGQATAQTPGPLTPNVPRTPNPKHADIIKQMGVENVIERLAGKEDPATIAKVLEQHFLKPAQKKWLSEQTSESLENIVSDYLSERKKPENAENLQNQEEISPEKPEIEKSKAVLTPSGDIGTTIKESKGVASVDVDGKQKNFREQDVIKTPIPEKDIADIYQELIDKIPESERSAVINVAGYDPNHNELIFMPHTGALYVYKDIPPEFAEKLQGAMFKAKTTGENLYGAWAEGESSRFAGLSKLIRELQQLYGGKGKEYIRKYEKIYDFLALPKTALKEKEKKKREEERARQGKKPRKPRSS